MRDDRRRVVRVDRGGERWRVSSMLESAEENISMQGKGGK